MKSRWATYRRDVPQVFHHPEAGYVDALVTFRRLQGGDDVRLRQDARVWQTTGGQGAWMVAR